MKIIVLSRKEELYSTRRLVESIRSLGHEAEVLNYLHCFITIERDAPQLLYKEDLLLDDMDAVIPRIGATYTSFGCAILRQMEMMNIFTANSSQAIIHSRDKLRAHQILVANGIQMPSTGFARSIHEVDFLVEKMGGYPIVLKLLEGTHGNGVVLVENRKQARSTLDAFYSLKTQILLQEFIPEARNSDIRVLVVGNKVIAGVKRSAAPGEFRSNLHKGGEAMEVELTEQQKEMAIRATQSLQLHVAGVDMLESNRGPLIIEVNSSPGLQGIEKATKLDIAHQIIQFTTNQVNSQR